MADLFRTIARAEAAYSAKDIEVLEGLEPVRRRPGMYIGGTDERAMNHLVAEVLDNAMDEAVAGHATRIEIELGGEEPSRAFKLLEFLEHPLWRTYVFVYAEGEALLTRWLEAVPEAEQAARFGRLLREQLTPAAVTVPG